MRNPFAKVSNPSDFVSQPGDEFHIEYSSRLMPNGTIQLTPCGKTDISASINSYKDQTDIAFVLERLEAGDTSMLSPTMLYGDFTNVPKTYADAVNMLLDVKHDFEQLPLEVRKEFDNDVMKYMESAGSDSWLKKVGSFYGYNEGNNNGTESSSELGSSTLNGHYTDSIKEAVSEVISK